MDALGRVLLADLAARPALRELAILRVARLTPHAEYEWVQHVPIAKAVGASDAQVRRSSATSPRRTASPPDERAVLRFTTEVVRDARASRRDPRGVARLLSPREVVELLMVIGQYMMVARVMATTEMEIDEPADPAALSRLRSPAVPCAVVHISHFGSVPVAVD